MGISWRAAALVCCSLFALGNDGTAYAATAGDTAAGSINVADTYILGPGDELMVVDFSAGDINQPYKSPQIPILPDGTACIHLAGTVKLGGLSLRQANELVNSLAAKYVLHPDVQVMVCRTRPANIYVLGSVVRPGVYTNDRPSSQQNPVSGRANMTLATALQMAGGAKENADVRHIVVTRAGNRRQETVDVWQMLVKGDVSQDVVLNPGDSIFVPKGGENYSSEQLGLAACQKRNVRVWGAIKTPGIYEMTSSDDLLSLISKAGGFCHYANTNYITLSRTERDGSITTKSIPVEAKGTLNESKSVVRSIVSPGDLIIIHRSIPKTIASMFRLASLDK